MSIAVINSPIGKLKLIEENEKLVEIKFLSDDFEIIPPSTELLKEVEIQLSEYFNNQRKEFSFPFEIEGTEFRKKVYKELIKIPYGKTSTYSKIAKRIGNPKASRAVGGANNKNRLPIIIPCHRVIGKDGKLVGYEGGLEKKIKLLEIEGVFI